MFENITFPASSCETDYPAPEREGNESDVQLISSEREAVFSWKGRQLIHFISPVKVAGGEILDWMNKSVIRELISLENVTGRNGISIMARDIAPPYPEGFYPLQEKSSRSLLLNPQWFSVYFISGLKLFLPEDENSRVREIYDQLRRFFEPGTALIDYGNHKIYLMSFTAPPAA